MRSSLLFRDLMQKEIKKELQAKYNRTPSRAVKTAFDGAF